MILKNKCWIFKKAFPIHFCKKIIEYALQKQIKKGVIGDPLFYENKANLISPEIVRDSEVAWLDDKWLYNKLIKLVELANTNAGWNFEISTAEKIQFTIYKKGMHYDWHTDAFEEPFMDHKNPFINGKTRKISLSMLLNDATEYKGGEFEIDSGNRREQVKTCYELEDAGDCLIFPSDLYHKVRPVTHGNRFSLVMWTLGNPFK
jgi:PKHD-type hydroxylase